MKISITLAILALSMILSACSVEPVPINYGNDNCVYCNMTIMDPKFGAEAVNSNGKAYKFDAIECMVRYLHDVTVEKEDLSLYLVNTIDKPSELFDAEQAHYLISENLPSPMGAFLSGYISRESAKKMQSEKDGTIYDWKELNELVKRSIQSH